MSLLPSKENVWKIYTKRISNKLPTGFHKVTLHHLKLAVNKETEVMYPLPMRSKWLARVTYHNKSEVVVGQGKCSRAR